MTWLGRQIILTTFLIVLCLPFVDGVNSHSSPILGIIILHLAAERLVSPARNGGLRFGLRFRAARFWSGCILYWAVSTSLTFNISSRISFVALQAKFLIVN